MLIRESTQRDIPKIVDLWVKFMEEHDTLIIGENPALKDFELKDAKMAESYGKFLAQNIGSKNGAVFLAEESGNIAGYTLVYVKDEIPIYQNKKLGYISDLYVREKFRHKAISSALKNKALEWFRERGIIFVSIAVSPDNKLAHSIYRKWGFMDYKTDMRKKI